MNRPAKMLLVLGATAGLSLTASPALTDPPTTTTGGGCVTQLDGGSYCTDITNRERTGENKTQYSQEGTFILERADGSGFETESTTRGQVSDDGSEKYRNRSTTTTTDAAGNTTTCRDSFSRTTDADGTVTKQKQDQKCK